MDLNKIIKQINVYSNITQIFYCIVCKTNLHLNTNLNTYMKQIHISLFTNTYVV